MEVLDSTWEGLKCREFKKPHPASEVPELFLQRGWTHPAAENYPQRLFLI